MEFGKVISADSHLFNTDGKIGPLSLRGRSSSIISLFTLEGRLITVSSQEIGCGPDFIVCESLPDNQLELPEDGWILEDRKLKIPFVTQLDFSEAKKFNSSEFSVVTDFPGHLEHLLSRILRNNQGEGEEQLRARLARLSSALLARQTESVEIPLVDLVGYGQGTIPTGDAAICGMLLTARSFSLGQRIKVNWFSRLSMELRRFIHRTSPHGKNWLNYALEGRTSELQKRFFKAMADDFECADEIVVKNMVADHIFNGQAFITGANFALDMIRDRFF